MKIGITLPPGLVRSEQLLSYARRVEDVGFDSLWFLDRLIGRHPTLAGSWTDPLLTIAHVAAVTRRIDLGTKVLVLPYRHLIHTAKMTATLDYLTSGRLILGVGVGWMPSEFESLGLLLKDRGRMTDEILEILKKLWGTDEVNHNGPYFSFHGVTIDPKPVQTGGPAIWYGGGSISPKGLEQNPTLGPRDPRPVMRRIGRLAAGWMPQFSLSTDDLVRADWDLICKYAMEFGRDPGGIERVLSASVYLYDEKDMGVAANEVERFTAMSFDDARRRHFVGTAAEVLPRLQAILDAGFWTYLLLSPLSTSTEQLLSMAEHLVPVLSAVKRPA